MGDSKIQRILGKEALAKRPRKALHPKVVALLAAPDAKLLLFLSYLAQSLFLQVCLHFTNLQLSALATNQSTFNFFRKRKGLN